MMNTPTSLVGSIVERKSGSPAASRPPKLNGSEVTGFPAAKHRSQSAFAKSRSGVSKSNVASRLRDVPVVERAQAASPAAGPSRIVSTTEGDWRRQVEEENQRRVENMTAEEREQEQQEILERFGPNIAEVLRKAREARERGSSEPMAKEALSVDTTLKSPSSEKRVIKSA